MKSDDRSRVIFWSSLGVALVCLVAVSRWPVERCVAVDPSGSCDAPIFAYGSLLLVVCSVGVGALLACTIHGTKLIQQQKKRAKK